MWESAASFGGPDTVTMLSVCNHEHDAEVASPLRMEDLHYMTILKRAFLSKQVSSHLVIALVLYSITLHVPPSAPQDYHLSSVVLWYEGAALMYHFCPSA